MSARDSRFRRLLVAPLVLGVMLMLAACGGGESSAGGDTATSTAAPGTATATASASAASATPTPGGNERVAQNGDTVSVNYTGKLDDGEVFDSSAGRDPLQFTVGSGQVIPGFDNAVLGLAVGDTVTVRLEPDQAYGPRDESLIFDVPIANAPEGLQVGDQVVLSGGQPAVVVAVTDTMVRIDANHALAGQALTFDIELVAIQ